MSEDARNRITNIVEQILEQGQRLRNAMVKSILDNDPFYSDVTEKNSPNTDNQSFHAHNHNQNFLNYDWSTLSPLDSPPTMSGGCSHIYCKCEICTAYGNHTHWPDKNLPCKNLKKHSISSLHLQEVGKPRPPLYPSKFSFDRRLPQDILREKALRDMVVPDYNKIMESNQTTRSSRATTAVQTQLDYPEEVTKSIQDNYRLKAVEHFKYVNSLKITINSLTLNQAGNRKVHTSSVDSKYKLPASINHSYFVEYSVPECLINNAVQRKIQSKIDSGLSKKNLQRTCSKKLQNEEIYFKHTSIHDIVNLLQLDLQNIEIRFQVSCRTMKQKHSNVIGYATFQMNLFQVTKNLCCNQEFPILSDDFVLGTLKITLQLGCGRMYFGKEFVDFVNNNMKNLESIQTSGESEIPTGEYNTLSSQQADSVIFVENRNDSKAVTTNKQKGPVVNLSGNSSVPMTPSLQQRIGGDGDIKTSNRSNSKYGYLNRQQNSKEGSRNTSARNTVVAYSRQANEYDYPRLQQQSSNEESIKASIARAPVDDDKYMKNRGNDYSTLDTNPLSFRSVGVKENTNFVHFSQHADVENKSLLYGLIYVSEARYFEGPINSYFSCQGFCQGITLCSRVVYNNREPIFNFYQKVPFLLDEAFLLYMKSNSILINFWEKYEDEDIAIGKSQLSLHQFFIAYRNKVIADTLLQSRLPVTISDWWEPICSPVDGKIYGQMKVLVAIGTPAQIYNLEVERGLKDDTSSVTYVPIVTEVKSSKQEENMSFPNDSSLKRPTNKNINNNHNKKVSLSGSPLGLASSRTEQEAAHTNRDETETIKTVDIGVQSNVDTASQTIMEPQMDNTRNNVLETLISQLIEQKQRNIYVESATNTEDISNDSNDADKQLSNEKLRNSVANNLNKLDQSKNTTNMQLRKTSDLLDYLNQALSLNNRVIRPPSPAEDENNFKAQVVVEGALHLPCKRKCRSKKTKKKGITYDDVLPSTYVTFETVPGAELQVTPVVQKSSNPQWDYRCEVTLPGEILTNSHKRLIFKVWRKSSGNSSEPDLQSDGIIGFAALDLTVLLSGLPSVQGWFNIVDFTFKCNGQIKIHITPVENISRFNPIRTPQAINHESPTTTTTITSPKNNIVHEQQPPIVDLREEPSELLNRALKRKFTELEEITQRLRTRLADITNDDSDTSNDEFADEFEKDISSVHVEDNYNMISLDEDDRMQLSLLDLPNSYLLKQTRIENPTMNMHSSYSKDIELPRLVPSDSAYSSTHISDKLENFNRPFAGTSFTSITPDEEISESGSQMLQRNSPNNLSTSSGVGIGGGDSQLKAGRQRIDQLLEKLTQLSAVDKAESLFSSRYVSGCSVNQEMPVSNNEVKPENNFNIDDVLNSAFFNRLCSMEVNTDSHKTKDSDELDSSSNAQIDDCSSSSLLTQFSTYRQAPDGAGHNAEGNNIRISK